MRRKGLSLAEVISCAAIVAILAAIIFPTYLGAKQRAQVSSCSTNLGSIGKAIMLYTADSDGLLPPWATSHSLVDHRGKFFRGDPERWRSALISYGASVEQFWCPLDKRRREEYFGFGESTAVPRWRYTSYMYNPTFGPEFSGPNDTFRLNLFGLDVKTVILSDAVWPDESAPEINRLVGHHGRRVNALYPDGRVRNGLVEDL